MKRVLTILFIFVLLFFPDVKNAPSQERNQSTNHTRTFYVATNGNDQWSGTLRKPSLSAKDGPFATLRQARDAIRELRKSGSKDAFTVLVRGGVYQLSETFVLDQTDSGTESAPAVFRAFPNEHPILNGTRMINNFEPYKGKILKASLKGIIKESYPVRQLFANGKRKILARYPNFDQRNPISGGYLYVESPVKEGSKNEFKYSDDSIKELPNPQDAEVVIFTGNGWMNNILTVLGIDRNARIITLSKKANYEIKSGNRYFVQNLLEELDSPGEWYFDRKDNIIYYWPANVASLKNVTIPILKTIVEIKGGGIVESYATPSYIRVEGFTLVGCEGSAVVVNGAKNTTIGGNTIYNAGNCGIEINDGFENSVFGNDIYDVGGDGITISGGDRKNLIPANNRAENNYIYNMGIYFKGSNGIYCGGVGNVISHNLIHSTPRAGIYLNGNDHLVEYNHVHHVNQETHDSGIIYCSGVDWTKRGNVIQFNYFHDSGGYGRNNANVAWQTPFNTFGIYLDDWLSGTKVYGNIVAKTASGGIVIHSGRDNVVENNIIIEGGGLGQMIYSAWPPSHPVAQKLLPGMFAKIREIDCKQYPQLSSITDIDTGAKMSGNSFIRNVVYYNDQSAILYGIKNDIDFATTKSDYNVIYHSGASLLIPFTKASADKQWQAWRDKGLDYHSLIADPLFTDVKNSDFHLAPNSPALKMGFKPIPIKNIGLYQDPLRASWPIKE